MGSGRIKLAQDMQHTEWLQCDVLTVVTLCFVLFCVLCCAVLTVALTWRIVQ